MLFCPSCHNAVPVAPQRAGQPVVCPACGTSLIASPSAFDAYYTWLGIPPSEQPPNHYRLLGLQLFEANPQVIEHAADRQMKHLQAFKIGPRAGESQRLLTEVAAARLVLLDIASKHAYDQLLHRELAERARVALPRSTPPDPAVESSAPVPALSIPARSTRPYRRRRPRSVLMLVVLTLGGIAGSLLGILAVFYLTGLRFTHG